MTGPLAIAGWALLAIVLALAAVGRRAYAIRTEAVAFACHELRGPLTAIALGVECGARLGSLGPAHLRAIELELGRATLALDDLAAAPAGRIRATAATAALRGPVTPVDVGELLAGSVAAWRPAAAAAGAELRLRTPAHPVLVDGERLRLAQATGNLIANAIEHGGGAIEVSLRSERGSVRIEIVDGGPGLPAPVVELARARRRRARRGPGGRGHGLAVARSVAVAHGGRLAAAPSERGARMVLELPLAHPAVAGSPVRR